MKSRILSDSGIILEGVSLCMNKEVDFYVVLGCFSQSVLDYQIVFNLICKALCEMAFQHLTYHFNM